MKKFITSVVCLLTISAVQAQTDSANVYLQKGLVEKTAQRYLVASQDFNKAIQFDPKFKDAYLQDADVNVQMHRTDNAKADYQKVYEMDPANALAIEKLTQLYYDYHQYQQAIDFAAKCKTCVNAERIIAMCNYQLENYDETILGLQDVIQKNPTDAEAAYTIARSYLEEEEYIKAVPYYQNAVRLAPTKSDWVYELGLLYYTNDDYKDAVAAFDQAASLGYLQSNDFNENLGFACVYSGNTDRGEKLLLAILQKRASDRDLIRGIADAYYSVHLYDKSIEFCQKLMVLDAKDGKALYEAGMCFQKKGEVSKGQQMCDAAIAMDPSLSGLRQKESSMGL